MSKISTDQTSCKRCGTCCKKGGPTLHIEDRQIISEGRIETSHLITLRKGELAYGPTGATLKPIPQELIKIAGRGRGWECIFLDKKEASCMIYAHRPLECRLLKCWDTSDILQVICTDTLKRTDIINPQDPILRLIEEHEMTCSVLEMEAILSTFSGGSDKSAPLNRLAELVRKDLHIRSRAVSVFALPLAAELFILGRPIFALLSCRGISVYEKNGRIHVEESSRNSRTRDKIDPKPPCEDEE